MDVDVKSKDVDEFFENYIPAHTPTQRPQYQPFEASSKVQKRIKVIRSDGSAIFVAYQFLIRFLLSSPDAMLTLIFSDVVITLEGKNLAQIADHLHEEKIKAITCFNPEKYALPEAGEVHIISILEQLPSEFLLE